MNRCKDKCSTWYKFYRKTGFKPSMKKYTAGIKFCAICSTYMEYEGIRCPCCGCVLRTKPRAANRRRVKVTVS